MTPDQEKHGLVSKLKWYILQLRNPSPYWRVQSTAWGIALVVLIVGGGLFAFIGLYGIFGGGTITFDAKGSPGPVRFSHYTHMWFQNGKYKACETCHDKLFAAQKYGTYVIRALMNSPERKVRIGKEASTLFVPQATAATDEVLLTYEVTRACKTCATGTCHDGKESFGRFECLKCHKRR